MAQAFVDFFYEHAVFLREDVVRSFSRYDQKTSKLNAILKYYYADTVRSSKYDLGCVPH